MASFFPNFVATEPLYHNPSVMLPQLHSVEIGTFVLLRDNATTTVCRIVVANHASLHVNIFDRASGMPWYHTMPDLASSGRGEERFLVEVSQTLEKRVVSPSDVVSIAFVFRADDLEEGSLACDGRVNLFCHTEEVGQH